VEQSDKALLENLQNKLKLIEQEYWKTVGKIEVLQELDKKEDDKELQKK